MRNRDAFAKRYGAVKVDAIGLKVAARKMAQIERTKSLSEKLFAQANATFAAAKTEEEIGTLGPMILSFNESKEDWPAYAAAAVRYIDGAKIDNPGALNAVAWTFYEHVDDPAMLARAADWAKIALAKEESYAVADTYAAVLYKLGRKSEAEKAAEHAIELGRKDGADFASTQELLGKIRAL